MSIEFNKCFGLDTDAECLLIVLYMKVLVIPWFDLTDWCEWFSFVPEKT